MFTLPLFATSSGIFIGARTAIADTDYTILGTDYFIGYATLTANRTVTLPTAIGRAGQVFIIKDEAGQGAVHSIIFATTGGQSILGINPNITSTYGAQRFYSTGAAWAMF